ncbi:MAG: hypothetical protein ABS79_01330 [Planctomycetes bacterium SCN 63-9]|nr:MAG: hypothetical protein ABS79_01330 [Planctomycetes bacterium SCN 63-9]
MEVDESGSIDDRKLAALFAYEAGLAVGEADGPGLGAEPELDHEMAGLRECVRLLEEVLPPRSGPISKAPDGPDSATARERIGRFEVLGELGRGGFGVVLRAFDPALKRQVALKVPRPEFLVHPEGKRRFLREGWAASRLEHPNIVQVLEAGEAGPIGYIASAICEGPSLAAWLANRAEPVPARMAARLLASLAGAIAHAHARDVLHRDLKPANILLQGADSETPAAVSSNALPFVPRLCDFGLAKLLDQAADDTRTAPVIGSPPYMAPEQADGRLDRIGPATDIYGLGAILYELLTGRPPFRGENSLETIRLVLEDDPPSPRSLRPGLPRDLETIALKCLEKCPADRYASAALLADELGRFLDDRPIAARPAGVLRRSVKWARRRPAQAVFGGFLLLTALGAAGALVGGQWWQARQNARLREVNDRLEATNTQLGQVNDRLEATIARAEQTDRDARHRLFGSLVKQSQLALDDGHEELALDLLKSVADIRTPPAEEIGFSWSHLDRRIRCRLSVLAKGHRPVFFVQASPDGKTLAAFHDQGPLILWDMAGGEPRGSAAGPIQHFRGIAFSADSRTLAVSHHDGLPRVSFWDASTGQPWGARLTTRRSLTDLYLSDDGRTLAGIPHTATLPEHRLYYWDLSAGPGGPITPLDERAGAARLGFDRDNPTLRLIADALDGKPVEPPASMPGIPRGVEFTADSEIVVTSLGGPSIEIRDRSMIHAASSIPFGPLAYTLSPPLSKPAHPASVPDWEVRIERLHKLAPPGRRELPFRRLDSSGVPLRFSSRGDKLAIRGADATAQLVDLATGGVTMLDLEANLTAVNFSADSRVLILGGFDGRIRLRNLQPPEEPSSFQVHPKQPDLEEVWGLCWSPDGKFLATASDDGVIRVWSFDPESDAPPRQIASMEGHRALVTSVNWSRDGKTLVSSGYNPPDVRVWDAATWTCRAVLTGHRKIIRQAAIGPDGRAIVSGGDDGAIRIWSAGHPEVRRDPLPAHAGSVSCVAFSPDGKTFASSGRDGVVALRDPADGRVIHSWEIETAASAIAYSPDGTRLACSDSLGTIRVWDLGDLPGLPPLILQGHARWAQSLAFSPDGKTLASGGFDQTVRIWDLGTGQELLALAGHTKRVNGVAFSPDGKTLASCDHAGVVKLWRGDPR